MAPVDSDLIACLGAWLREGGSLSAVNTCGYYLDLDKPWHPLEANRILTAAWAAKIAEDSLAESSFIDPSAKIEGRVALGENSRIGAGVVVRGNLRVGRNTVIDNGVRPHFAPRRHHHRPLHEAAEVVVDNGGIPGDAALSLEGLAAPVAATSTVTGAALLQCAAARAVELLLERGAAPELYSSSNVDGGDRANLEYIAKYRRRFHTSNRKGDFK